MAAEVRARSRVEESRRLAAAVADDPIIEEHHPGLGRILARHVEAAWALGGQIHDLQNEQQQVGNCPLSAAKFLLSLNAHITMQFDQSP